MMQNQNKVEFKVYGRYALFTDPITRVGGEKFSYQIPTYQALKGITESVYWKPTLIWYVDKVRVMKPIRTQTRSAKPIIYGDSGGHSLSIYTYLYDVEYRIQAHFEWNLHREDMVQDRNENKHYFVAKRMIDRGGRRDVFLGTRECQGYVEPSPFHAGKGFYDDCDELNFDLMFHGFDYPDETGDQQLGARFWRPKMKNGIIEFVRPGQCEVRKVIRGMLPKDIKSSGLEEEDLLLGYQEELAKK